MFNNKLIINFYKEIKLLCFLLCYKILLMEAQKKSSIVIDIK